MAKHQWRSQEAEGLRFFRAEHHGGKWKISSQLKGEEEWTRHEPVDADLWRALRDVLWRKYQRGRCPWELIERIDKILEDGDTAAGNQGTR